MSKGQHTPGPWRVSVGDLVVGANGRRVADCEHTPYLERPAASIPEDEANARLIAAAPELLEALECVLRDADRVAAGHAVTAAGMERRRAARALLARVRGEA